MYSLSKFSTIILECQITNKVENNSKCFGFYGFWIGLFGLFSGSTNSHNNKRTGKPQMVKSKIT